MRSQGEYLVRYANGSLSKGFRGRDQALEQASADDQSGPIPIAIIHREGEAETNIFAGDVLSSAIRELKEKRVKR